MNLGDLQSARSKERQKDSLQHLREDFYTDVGTFIAELRTERERAAEAADDPFDAPEVRRLTDDIKTAENTVEAIYERRVGKLVKLASLAAAGMPAEREGLTAEETDLFETLVDGIESNRAHVLDDVLAGENGADSTTETPSDEAEPTTADAEVETASPNATGPDTAPEAMDAAGVSDTEATPTEADGGVSAADAMGTATETQGGPSDAGSAVDESATEAERTPAGADDRAPAGADDTGGETPTLDTERTTVRITRDVGEVFGVDEHTYQLSAEDVVTLPAVNATPLIERDAAEKLD